MDVLPRMSLEEVARELAGAKFVVSVDTGLSHLTAALDRPNITLYGQDQSGTDWGIWEESVRAKESFREDVNSECGCRQSIIA